MGDEITNIVSHNGDLVKLKNAITGLLNADGVPKIKRIAEETMQLFTNAQNDVAKGAQVAQVTIDVKAEVKRIVQELKNAMPTDNTNAIKELTNKISNLQEASQCAKTWNLVI